MAISRLPVSRATVVGVNVCVCVCARARVFRVQRPCRPPDGARHDERSAEHGRDDARTESWCRAAHGEGGEGEGGEGEGKGEEEVMTVGSVPLVA